VTLAVTIAMTFVTDRAPLQTDGTFKVDLVVAANLRFDLNGGFTLYFCDALVKFVKDLPAPVVRTPDNAALRDSLQAGERLFAKVGCASCHTPQLGEVAGIYSDLLLHDMGPGLNDGIKEGAAEAGEWRTAPVWNVAAALKLGGLLHDARARNVAEAIEWHDGEAAASRTRFQSLTPADKAALVDFVSRL